MIRTIDLGELRAGRADPLTCAVTSGLEILIRGLENRFGQYGIETSTDAIIKLLIERAPPGFLDAQRNNGETALMVAPCNS